MHHATTKSPLEAPHAAHASMQTVLALTVGGSRIEQIPLEAGMHHVTDGPSQRHGHGAGPRSKKAFKDGRS